MTQRGPFFFLVLLLVLTGVSTAVYRHQTFGIPYVPSSELRVWQVEARIQYLGDGRESQVFLTLPPEQSGFRFIEGSNLGASQGFGYVPPNEFERRAHWTKRAARGEQTLFYKLDLVDSPDQYVADAEPEGPTDPLWIEPYETAANQVLDAVLPITADGLSLAQQLALRMTTTPLDQNMSLLLDAYAPADLLSDLLNTARTPARTVEVLRLEDGRRRQTLITYVQVWDGQRWQLFDPVEGPVANNSNLLLWVTDAPGLLEVVGGRSSRVSFSMIATTRPSLAVSNEQFGDYGFSLYSLPIAEQGMFKIIMLLPIGALVVVFMRVIVGFRTSGTFMPVLIALAFLQTELVPGVASFLLVVTIGLLIRSYLSALNLLLVARIAVLVVLVIGIVTVFSVISYRLELIGGLTITFFPMIILAWTIERMSILWEEEGPKEVLVQGGGSLLVAILAYFMMNISLVRHIAFNFPELHLVVLAVILLCGRYTGYRLLELRRFAAFKASHS